MVFVAICVVGIDFLIYVLFQWTYGDSQREVARRIAARRGAMPGEATRPFVVSSGRGGAVTQARLQKVRERMAGHGVRWFARKPRSG
jgi:hypothetical protein